MSNTHNQPHRPIVVKSREVFKREKFTPKTEKPKGWSHEAELLAAKGKPIVLATLDGSPVEATLLEADRFTVKVESEGKTVVLFKHAISGYQIAAE